MSTVYTFNSKVLKNTSTDKWLAKKEGPSFDSVTIGSQIWMSKNLAIDDGQGGITIVDNVTANGINFGTQYYYTWDAAVRVANSIQGWHLPSTSEWNTLVNNVGGNDVAGKKLKSTTGWNDSKNGTDDYGFTAVPIDSSRLGSRGTFWTSNELSSANAFIRYVTVIDAMSSYNSSKSSGYSIRLIKDT